MRAPELKEQSNSLSELMISLTSKMRDFDFQDSSEKLKKFDTKRCQDGLALFREGDFYLIQKDIENNSIPELSGKIMQIMEERRDDDRSKAQVLHLYELIGWIHREQNNFAGFLAGFQKTLDFLKTDNRDFSELRLNLKLRVIYALEQFLGYAITYSHDFDEASALIEDLKEKIEKLDPNLIDIDTFRDNLRLNKASVCRRLGKYDEAEELLSEDHEVLCPQNLVHQQIYICELARAKEDQTDLEKCLEQLLLLIGGINGEGNLADFFEKLFADLDEQEKNDLVIRVQKEYLLCLLKLGQISNYKNKKESWSESWREKMADQAADSAMLKAELLLEECDCANTDDETEKKFQEAMALHKDNNLDFRAAETAIKYLNKFKECLPKENLELTFLRNWQVLEQNIAQKVMRVFTSESQETTNVSSILFEIAELITYLYESEGLDKAEILQQALRSLHKVIKVDLNEAKKKIILQNDDLPEDQHLKLEKAFDIKGLLAVSKTEDGWQKEYFQRAEEDDSFDWGYLISLPEVKAKLEEADKTQKTTELKHIFVNAENSAAVMHLIFLPNGPGLVSIVDRGEKTGFSDAEKQLMMPEKFPRKKITTGVATPKDKNLYEKVQEAVATYYLAVIPRFQITAAANIIFASSKKEILGGLSTNLLENEIEERGHLSYPEIFGGENFWSNLQTKIAERLKDGSLSEIWQKSLQNGEIEREQCAEVGGLAARDGSIAPAIFLETAKFCVGNNRPYIIMIRNKRVDRLFKMIGIETVDLGYADIRNNEVRSQLLKSGWTEDGLEAWEADYFNKKLNPRIVMVSSKQVLDALQNPPQKNK